MVNYGGLWSFAGGLRLFVVVNGHFLVVCGHLWFLPVLVTMFQQYIKNLSESEIEFLSSEKCSNVYIIRLENLVN